MDILTGKCSDRFMAHVLKRRDQEAVRWYVLTLPTAGGGRDRISPSKGLDAELSRRERRGEALFEYFSPSYVEARKVGGKMAFCDSEIFDDSGKLITAGHTVMYFTGTKLL